MGENDACIPFRPTARLEKRFQTMKHFHTSVIRSLPWAPIAGHKDPTARAKDKEQRPSHSDSNSVVSHKSRAGHKDRVAAATRSLWPARPFGSPRVLATTGPNFKVLLMELGCNRVRLLARFQGLLVVLRVGVPQFLIFGRNHHVGPEGVRGVPTRRVAWQGNLLHLRQWQNRLGFSSWLKVWATARITRRPGCLWTERRSESWAWVRQPRRSKLGFWLKSPTWTFLAASLRLSSRISELLKWFETIWGFEGGSRKLSSCQRSGQRVVLFWRKTKWNLVWRYTSHVLCHVSIFKKGTHVRSSQNETKRLQGFFATFFWNSVTTC